MRWKRYLPGFELRLDVGGSELRWLLGEVRVSSADSVGPPTASNARALTRSVAPGLVLQLPLHRLTSLGLMVAWQVWQKKW